jgi:choline-glycine betaine transporter
MASNGWIGGQLATPVLVVIVAVLTACFVASAVSGISRGIQWLSNINMVLAAVLAVIVFVAGPTLFILNLIPAAVGDYARDLAEMASRTEAVGDEALRTWMSGWTIFYWAWWVSWTPFVGLFIARISRGRTIRQFVTGVLLVPSIVSVIWFGIFGGAAINIQSTADATPDTSDGLAKIVDGKPSISFDGALFDLLHHLSLPSVIAAAVSILAMVLVAIFFVTGADAASIVSALPFVIVMFLMCFALTRDLRRDPLSLRSRLVTSVVERSIRSGVEKHGGVQFDLVTKHECDERCAKDELDPSGEKHH